MKRVSIFVFFVIISSLIVDADEFSKRVGFGTAGGAGTAMTRSYSELGASLMLASPANICCGWISVTEFKNDGSYNDKIRIYRTGGYSIGGADIASQNVPPHEGYAVAGADGRSSPTLSDAYIYVVDASGDYQWRAGGDYDDSFQAIEPTPDGGYVVAGIDKNGGSDSAVNVLVGKTNGSSFSWLKSYDFFDTANSVSLKDQAYDIDLRYNSFGQLIGYVVVGSTTVIGSTRKRGFILFLDTNGNVTSFDTVQDVGVSIEFRSVEYFPALNGVPKVTLGGSCGSDSLFLHYSSSGVVWYQCLNVQSGADFVRSITLPTTSYVIGDFNGPAGVVLAKLQLSDGAISWVKNYQEGAQVPSIISRASDGDLLISSDKPTPAPNHAVVIKTTQDFGGLPTNCNINTSSYSPVTLTLSTSTSDTSVNSSNITATAGDAIVDVPNVSVTDNCQ